MNRAPLGRKPGKYTQATRTLKLLSMIRETRSAVFLVTLARDLEVSVRTIRRDLHVLIAARPKIELLIINGDSAVRLRRDGK